MKFIALILEVMSDSIEDRFKRDLVARYERNKKDLIPKDVYYTMLEDVTVACQNKNTLLLHGVPAEEEETSYNRGCGASNHVYRFQLQRPGQFD